MHINNVFYLILVFWLSPMVFYHSIIYERNDMIGGKGERKTTYIKVVCDDATNALFIRLCIKQIRVIRVGNQPHMNFNKIGWECIIAKFNEQMGKKYTRFSLKNIGMYLRWIGYCGNHWRKKKLNSDGIP